MIVSGSRDFERWLEKLYTYSKCLKNFDLKTFFDALDRRMMDGYCLLIPPSLFFMCCYSYEEGENGIFRS